MSEILIEKPTLHQRLVAESARHEGLMGVLSWSVLEMFRRGGMNAEALGHFQDQLDTYAARASQEDCADILRVVEERLETARLLSTDSWN